MKSLRKRNPSPSFLSNYDSQLTMEDEQTESYGDGEFGYGIEPKRSKSTITVIAIALVFAVVAVGTITITYFTDLTGEITEELGLDDSVRIDATDEIIPDEAIIQLELTDQLPSALSQREFDWVAVHMDHLDPHITELQSTLHWAKDTHLNDTTSALYGQMPTLQLIESEIIEGAKLNDNKITRGEQIMLEIISWATYPEICEGEDSTYVNCAFFDINYQESRYQTGEITRDEYWVNVKQYANQTTVDEVEGNIGG